MPGEEHGYRYHLLYIRRGCLEEKKRVLCLPLPPSGSRGFMLGEILGLRAGLTRLELTLFLFFELRAVFESALLPEAMEKAGLVGVDMGSSIGLGLPDMVPPGVLCGPIFGVFLANNRGVSWSSS